MSELQIVEAGDDDGSWLRFETLLPRVWTGLPNVNPAAVLSLESAEWKARLRSPNVRTWIASRGDETLGAVVSEFLEFDTQLFQKKMGRFTLILPDDTSSERLRAGAELMATGCKRAESEGWKHATTRTAGKDQAAIISAEASGFRLMTTHLSLYLECRPEPSPPPIGILLRDAKDSDLSAAQAIAADYPYPLSRFNLDAFFDENACKAFYSEWTKNALAGRSKWFMVLEDEEEKILGYSFWDEGPAFGNEGVRVIDHTLASIPTSIRRRGLFNSFITAGLNRGFDEGYRYQTGVININNIPCLRSYFKNGASIAASHHTLSRSF